MNECIFCNIVAGRIKASLVYEDEVAVAFRDISPQAPVHILIVPKKHVPRFTALEEKDYSFMGHLVEVVKKLTKQEKIDQSGFRLVTNEGKDSGQTVHHLHFHLLGGKDLGGFQG